MFTMLLAGLCGIIVEAHGIPYVVIGHPAVMTTEPPKLECEGFLTVPDGATIPPLPGFNHAVHVEIDSTGAHITIDDQNFVIAKATDL